jgi:NAD(P)-dependent dehydrogenase (short-subunit alcohol dehydrogenase family)
MNRLSGKVVVVTGAARAVHLADEGADIESNEYPLATEADLQETKELVAKSGRRVITGKVDVRDRGDLKKTLDHATADESRYVTGQQLFADPGAGLKMGL